MVIGFFKDKQGSSNFSQLMTLKNLRSVLIQLWVPHYNTKEGGQVYVELKTQSEPFYILSDVEGGLASYRMHSLASTFTIHQDENINKVEGQQPEAVIKRVFRNKKPEISPNISYYSLDEYPNRDFALRCGIRASYCVPIYKTMCWYHLPQPDGVIEFVSTSDDQIGFFRFYCRYYNTFLFRETKMYLLSHLVYGHPRSYSQSREYALVEMEHLLTVVCQTFPLPLAQYWVLTDTIIGSLRVMHQRSHIDFQRFTPWWNFKDACFRLGLILNEGQVGKSYLSHKSFLCKDITKFSITNYSLAHYASNCGTIACFTICLCSFTPQYRKCVLEFFLPYQEMDSNYPRTLLNSLLQTMKEQLPHYMVASGEQLGQVLSVEVIKSSTHDEPEYYIIGQSQSSLPHQDGLENEGDASQQLPRNLFLLYEDNTVRDEHVQDIETSVSRCISKRTTHDVAEISHVDELEQGSLMKYTEPRSLKSQPKRSEEILEHEWNSVEMDHSALEMTLKEIIKHRENTVADKILDKFVEESPVEDVAYAMSNEDVTYALRNEEGINLESLSKHFGRPLNDAAKSFGVSRSTFKRICRRLGVNRWRSGKRRISCNNSIKLRRGIINYGQPSRRNFSCTGTAPVHNTLVAQPSQELIKMSVKATYKGVIIRFELPALSGIGELEDNVIERLHLDRKSFSIKYQDEEGDWILIACDKDVWDCVKISRSLQKTTIKMLLDPPIIRNAP